MEVDQAQTPWRKCCFCFPLRKGLLFLAYLNVVGLVLSMIADMKGIPIDLISVTDMLAEVVMTNYIESLVWIWLLPFFIDLVFGIILIYAVHKNNPMVLYAYVWYGVTQILIEVYVGLVIYAHVFSNDVLLCVAFNVFFQGYITLLVRSLRIELNATKTVDSSSYCLKQSTNERDVESQPLPTAPSAHQGNINAENTVL